MKLDGPRSQKEMKQYFVKDITELARQLNSKKLDRDVEKYMRENKLETDISSKI